MFLNTQWYLRRGDIVNDLDKWAALKVHCSQIGNGISYYILVTWIQWLIYFPVMLDLTCTSKFWFYLPVHFLSCLGKEALSSSWITSPFLKFESSVVNSKLCMNTNLEFHKSALNNLSPFYILFKIWFRDLLWLISWWNLLYVWWMLCALCNPVSVMKFTTLARKKNHPKGCTL